MAAADEENAASSSALTASEREIAALVHDLLPGHADAAGEEEVAGRILQRVADLGSLHDSTKFVR